MKIAFDNKGIITISPSDSIDEYALEKWAAENKVGCEKIIIETRTNKPMGFRKKNEVQVGPESEVKNAKD